MQIESFARRSICARSSRSSRTSRRACGRDSTPSPGSNGVTSSARSSRRLRSTRAAPRSSTGFPRRSRLPARSPRTEVARRARSRVVDCVRGVISPLMANIYLHYVLDLWVSSWTRKHARGDVYVVRYADDLVMGFQREQDARAMHTALAERLAQFGLELHPDKTRVIRFGRFAHRDARLDGRTRPETFEFLGFTHIMAWDTRGWARLIHRTSRKKRNAKLASLRRQMRERRHDPPREQHAWLSSVLRGHYGYYGVPRNFPALASFYRHVRRFWHRSLQRRSQRACWTRECLEAFEARFALPPPRITHPPPESRFTGP